MIASRSSALLGDAEEEVEDQILQRIPAGEEEPVVEDKAIDGGTEREAAGSGKDHHASGSTHPSRWQNCNASSSPWAPPNAVLISRRLPTVRLDPKIEVRKAS